MWRKILTLLFLLCWMTGRPVLAQTTGSNNCSLTIPAIALIDIEPDATPITLTVTPPAEAGNPVTIGASGSNSTKWLNYTSAVTAGGPAKSINVRVTSGTVPTGVTLSVQAGAYTGPGAGVLGVSSGLVTVDNTARTIISGIGGCYTGNGSNAGHLLTYSLAISNYAQLNFNQNTALQITYTITD